MTEFNSFISIPDLSGVIRADDVSKKGTGAYTAEYVNWAKVAHLLQKHAPGWQFHLRMAPEGGYVWKAPNGTAFLVCYFTSPENVVTADFLQSVMDNKNNPIPYDRVSARDLTDTHRRALCAAACYTFGLAYQLWAKEPIEDPHRDPDPRDCARLFALCGDKIPKEQLDTLKPLLGCESWKLTHDWQYNLAIALVELSIAHGWETMFSLVTTYHGKNGSLERLAPDQVRRKIQELNEV